MRTRSRRSSICGSRLYCLRWPFSYRVGEPAATGGRLLAIWRRPMTVGDKLPPIPLPLTSEQEVTLDLDQTYARAAEDAYQT